MADHSGNSDKEEIKKDEVAEKNPSKEKKEVANNDRADDVDKNKDDALKEAMISADLEADRSSGENEMEYDPTPDQVERSPLHHHSPGTKHGQTQGSHDSQYSDVPRHQAPPVPLPQGWSYQSTSTGSRGYYTCKTEPTPGAPLAAINPDPTYALRVSQGGSGGGYSVNLGGPGNIIYATGGNMPFSIGAPTMLGASEPVVEKTPVKQRSTKENNPVTPTKVKLMPEKLKPMVERHYMMLKSPSFTRQKLEQVKIICGFDDTKDKIGIPEHDEKKVVVQKYYR